jgi:nucleoside-diphosphate kinase
MATETSLILFKPDAIEKNIVGTVLARFQAEGFLIRGIKMMQLDDAILRDH